MPPSLDQCVSADVDRPASCKPGRAFADASAMLAGAPTPLRSPRCGNRCTVGRSKGTLRMSPRKERAIELRDVALPVVKALGAWQETGSGPNLFSFNDAARRFHIAYRSPFQKMSPPSGETLRQSMVRGSLPKVNLPNGLDIWAASGKVLNIEWSDKDVLVVRAGPWESELERLAAGAAATAPSVPMIMRHLSPKSLASGRRTEITWLCQSET
jgi:hypothetical protein